MFVVGISEPEISEQRAEARGGVADSEAHERAQAEKLADEQRKLADEQRRVAEDTIADVEASGIWPGKVVTEVAAAGAFWEAEPEHQDYLQKYPDGYTCHFIRPNWKLPQRANA